MLMVLFLPNDFHLNFAIPQFFTHTNIAKVLLNLKLDK